MSLVIKTWYHLILHEMVLMTEFDRYLSKYWNQCPFFNSWPQNMWVNTYFLFFSSICLWLTWLVCLNKDHVLFIVYCLLKTKLLQTETIEAQLKFKIMQCNSQFLKLNKTSVCVFCTFQSFPVRSLGWVEMAEQDLCEGRSSVAVHHCIRQLSYCRRDIRDSAGVWGEVSHP